MRRSKIRSKSNMDSTSNQKVKIDLSRLLLVPSRVLDIFPDEDSTLDPLPYSMPPVIPNSSIPALIPKSTTTTSIIIPKGNQSLKSDDIINRTLLEEKRDEVVQVKKVETIKNPPMPSDVVQSKKRKGTESPEIEEIDFATMVHEDLMRTLRRSRNQQPLQKRHCEEPLSSQQPKNEEGNDCSEDDTNSENDEKPVAPKKTIYSVMFGKPSMRKHKIWQGDGFLIQSGLSLTLKDEEGKTLGSNMKFHLTEEMINEGKAFILGSKEVQIQGLAEGDAGIS